MYCVCFYYKIENFQILEKRESETVNEECVVKVYAFLLRLEKMRYNGRKATCKRRIQVSSNLEQVVIF